MSWVPEALEGVLGGFETVEHDLELVCGGERVAVDAIGKDAFGRTWFVVVASMGEDQAFGAVLDLLASVRSDADEIVRELIRDSRAEDVRVALLCERPTTELVRRAAAIDGLHVFEPVRWKRGGAEETRLVRRSSLESVSLDDFLAALDDTMRELARDCLDRLDTLDPELSIVAGPSSVLVRAERRMLARMQGRGGLLEGVAGAERSRIRTRGDAEQWLARVFHERFADLGDDGFEVLPKDEPPPKLPSGPLLSAEELAAFRD